MESIITTDKLYLCDWFFLIEILILTQSLKRVRTELMTDRLFQAKIHVEEIQCLGLDQR